MHSHPTSTQQSIYGFTLVELMITIAIIAIIASIAFPSYQNSVIKAGRADGKTSLMSAAQGMERCFTSFNAYDNASCTGTNVVPATSSERKYTLALVSAAATFTITATPAARQTADLECANLTINQAGQKGISGTGSVATCW